VSKNRRHGVRVGHALLAGLEQALSPVAALPGVSVCIPGRTRRTGSRPSGPALRAQADTPDGIKLAYRAGGAVQEVFVVTSDRQAVRTLLGGRP